MRISDWSSDVCSSDLDDVIKSLDILLFHTPLVFRLSAHSHLRRRACGGRCSLLDNDGRVVNDSPLKVTPCQQPLQCCTPCELTTRSEEHTSELQSLMRNSYAVFCLTKKN